MKNWERIESKREGFFGFFQILLDIQVGIPYNEGNRSDHAGGCLRAPGPGARPENDMNDPETIS